MPSRRASWRGVTAVWSNTSPLTHTDTAMTHTFWIGLWPGLSEAMLDRLDLADRDSALRGIHLPESMAHKEMARKRLAFDELFRVQTVLVGGKPAYERDARGIRHELGGELVRRFHAALPYPLTGAQQRVIAEIDADLARPIPMHRLLQGDVGSGKTVVALYAMLVTVAHGHQAVLMAPTEVLAT